MAAANKQLQRIAKRLFRWCLVNGELDEGRVRRVVRTVLDSRRRGYLPVLLSFHRLIQLEVSQHTAAVETPFVLPADLRARTQDTLQTQYGVRTVTKFIQRPELIAGMRVQVGCDVYDGTVKAKLELLEKRLRNISQP